MIHHRCTIAKANERASNENKDVPAKFYGGKVDEINKILAKGGETNFDAIIIMYNSIGYSNDRDDIRILKNLYRLGGSNCILIIESENRDWTVRNFLEYVLYDFDNIEIHETWKMDLERAMAESRSKFYRKNHDNRGLELALDLQTNLRLYSLYELKNAIISSGWLYHKAYGSILDLAPPTIDSQYLVTVSRKG